MSAAALAAATLATGPAASADPAPALTPIGGDFVSPLHLAFGPGKTLYVADAFTASIQKIKLRTGVRTTLFQGTQPIPGIDVASNGAIKATLSIGDPSVPLPTSLIGVNQAGKSWQLADLLAYEQANNPDGQDPNAPDAQSNPYSVLALKHRTIVADAGANDLLVVRHGKVSTLTAFPTFTADGCQLNNNGDTSCDPVPTDVELGPDGYLYVSGLGAEVEGHIYKVNQWTGEIVQTWGGLPPLTGIAVSSHGTIYASSIFAGVILKIGADGSTSAAQVPFPTDVEIGNGMLVVGSMPLTGGPGAVYRVAPSAFAPMP
jgi:hypothetical protein